MTRILNSTRYGQVIVAHLPVGEEIAKGLKLNGFKSIFIIRDPRDVIISHIYYIISRRSSFIYQAYHQCPTMKDRIKLSILGDPAQRVWPILKRYQWFADWLNSGALVVRFEELIGPAGGSNLETQFATIRSIFKHLGIPLAETDVMLIARKTFSQVSPTFRHGQKESWRDYFDKELINLFMDHAAGILVQYGYEQDNSG